MDPGIELLVAERWHALWNSMKKYVIMNNYLGII